MKISRKKFIKQASIVTAAGHKYHEETSILETLQLLQKEIADLDEFYKAHDIIRCYQNHSGTNVGASYWEIKKY